MSRFQFNKSLRQGNIGEALFYEANQGSLERIDGLNGDFVDVYSGAKTELKTDLWDMKVTPNLFMERYSDKAKGTPGGPWRAQVDGSEFFVYFYVTNLTYFRFRTDDLVARLETILPNLTPTDIANKTWTTLGYRVPRDLVLDLAETFDVKATSKKRGNDGGA